MIQFLFIFLLIGGCSSEKETAKPDEVVQVEDLGEDIHIPTKLWEHVWENATDFSFQELTLDLKEKTPGVLKSSYIQVHLPVGGGQIDLAKYMTGQKGTFFVSIYSDTDQEVEKEALFFVSRYDQVLSFGATIGSGCHKLLVFNEEFKKKIRHQGFEVNSTDGRHLSLLGGSFVLLQQVEGQNKMSQLTLVDSRYQDRKCLKEDE